MAAAATVTVVAAVVITLILERGLRIRLFA
jgi:hypothetical protein